MMLKKEIQKIVPILKKNKKINILIIYIAGFCRFSAHIIIQYVIHRHLTWQRNNLE